MRRTKTTSHSTVLQQTELGCYIKFNVAFWLKLLHPHYLFSAVCNQFITIHPPIAEWRNYYDTGANNACGPLWPEGPDSTSKYLKIFTFQRKKNKLKLTQKIDLD